MTGHTSIWTLDQRLGALAERFGAQHLPQAH